MSSEEDPKMTSEVKDDSNQKNVTEIKEEVQNVQTSNDLSAVQQNGCDVVLSFLKENATILSEIREIIQNRLEYDSVKEKAFDKLYEEMKRQKEASDLLDRILKPVLSDLLLLSDSMKKYKYSLLDKSMSESEQIQNFKYIEEELIEILYRQEVLPIEDSDTCTFNSKIHKATKTERAETKDDDFKIVNVVREGFTWRDKVLRPQEVVIKRYSN